MVCVLSAFMEFYYLVHHRQINEDTLVAINVAFVKTHCLLRAAVRLM